MLSGTFWMKQIKLRWKREIWYVGTALTGGTERCDWYQEPRRNDGSREEEGAAGRRDVCFFSWPLPVSLSKLKPSDSHKCFFAVCFLLTLICLCRADFFEDDEIKGLLKFKPWWSELSPSTEQEGEAGEFKSFCHEVELSFVAGIHLLFSCLFKNSYMNLHLFFSYLTLQWRDKLFTKTKVMSIIEYVWFAIWIAPKLQTTHCLRGLYNL